MSELDTVEIDFLTHLTSELVRNAPRREFNNLDSVRFPQPPSSLRAAAKKRFLALMAKRGFYRTSLFPENLLKEIFAIDGLARAYSLLADRQSKDLFVRLLAYRILGHQHVRLPLNNPEYWAMRRTVTRHIEKHDVVQGVPVLGSLDLCNIERDHKACRSAAGWGVTRQS